MDQIKIGRFVADCRKKAGLTQVQLAEKMGITDKAVSKWERGLAVPDASIMLNLCDVLDISVNELLSGEKINMENSNQKNEQLLVDLAKEVEQKDKTIWTSMWIILGVCFIALLVSLGVVKSLIPEGVWQIVGAIGISIVFVLPCFYALKLEVSVGAYKCKKCGYEIAPTYSKVLSSMHLGTTRYLKCPKCSQRSWCKKVLKK